MTHELLLENFEELAEAPNGVAKLRELILQLAVQGKLGTQDVNDEPANVLRREMESARQRTIDAGEIRRGDDFTAVGVDEAPYVLPEKWGWVRIGEVMHLINGKAFKPTDWLTSGLPIVRIQNLNNPDAPFNYSGEDVDDKVRLKNDDFLISWSGTPGTSFGAFIWNRGPAVLNQHIFRAILFGNAFIKPFLRIAVNARLDEMIAQAHGGVGLQHITKGKLERLSLPLPPLAEQRRIVGKVDQLLGLCDELAARQAARREARSALVGATLDRLVSARSAAEFPAHAHRLRDHFERLFDTPTTLPQLRQAILQLAVQGQLVPQDPNDEPAATLIARIAKKLAAQNEAKRGKRNGSASEESPHLQPHDLPSSWCWARFDQIATIASNLVPPKDFADLPHVAPDNIEKGTGRLLPYQTVAEDDVRSGNHRFYAGQILYSKIRPNLSKATIVDFDGLCSADMYPINSHIDPDFLLRFILSRTFLSMAVRNDTRVAMPKINQEELNRILIAVPPLSEQKRIVSKVTELLSLCDALEAKLTQAESASTQLLSAAVHHLLRGI